MLTGSTGVKGTIPHDPAQQRALPSIALEDV